MKKHLKLMAVLSAAGILSVVAPELGSFNTAATAYAKVVGWVEENGSWKFYDDNDSYVTDAWKKRGEDWFYLNENGEVATSTKIDEYYVDENGKRVSDKWISLANDEFWDSTDAPEYLWHFYGKNGKEIVSKWQKVDEKWFYFNDQGEMATGKVELDGNTYYFGPANDGVMKTGWVQLENDSDDVDDSLSWYYFDKSGRMISNQVDKKIDGSYYTFVNGVMQTGWYKLPSTATASEATATASEATADPSAVAGYQYYDPDNGTRAEGWKEIEGISGVSEEGTLHYFFFKNGAPYAAKKDLELFTIDSKKFAFNAQGEMQTGLQVVNLEDGTTANFYFGTDGAMATGKQTIYNEDLDENQVWFFQTEGSKKGQGVHGVRDNTLYENGLRKEADADLKIAPVTLDGRQYLVNASGSIQKAISSSKSAAKPELGAGFKDYKDSNDKVWTVDVNGIVK